MRCLYDLDGEGMSSLFCACDSRQYTAARKLLDVAAAVARPDDPAAFRVAAAAFARRLASREIGGDTRALLAHRISEAAKGLALARRAGCDARTLQSVSAELEALRALRARLDELAGVSAAPPRRKRAATK